MCGLIAENAKPVGGNQNNYILYCASPKAIQYFYFLFIFFSLPLAVSEGSYKHRLHCNTGICPPNVMSVLSLSATYPNFPITFPALLKWIKIKQQSLCLVAQLKVTKQESNCNQFGTNLWTPSNFILWQIIHVVNFQLCSIFAFYVMQ